MKNSITIKDIVDEDFINYKIPSMFIIFPNCNFKCGKDICQNYTLRHSPTKTILINNIVDRYINNPITKAFVFGGLEPFDSYNEMLSLIKAIRKKTEDTIVIYSGYEEEELIEEIFELKKEKNIIIKFGRFIPNTQQKKDDLLGIILASNNQYAVKIS